MLRHFLLIFILPGVVQAAIDLCLPTENQHLFSGDPERYYMYVDRIFEGETSKPWEGGTFGYVRNPMRIDDKVVFTRFHEGIDIAPVNRDSAGNPLDFVSSIADGQVVHTSMIAGHSNYGKYVVVEHKWENASIYSLYAHLAEITCQPGDPVKAGAVLGRMGYTGVGLNRTRAHLHLELAMLMSRHFEEWHKVGVGKVNYHGIFNGMNLAGCDPARFFVEHKANPELSISTYIGSIPVHFKVTVPAKGIPDFVTRYPWICHGSADGAVSWEISFSATGLPVAFTPSQRQVDAPVVTSILPSTIPQRYLTRNLVNGQENRATLTASGKQLVALLTDDFQTPAITTTEPKPESEALNSKRKR
jgi:murein DD-endopeptidase MepM/ murein hydrolase activator NlpD